MLKACVLGLVVRLSAAGVLFGSKLTLAKEFPKSNLSYVLACVPYNYKNVARN